MVVPNLPNAMKLNFDCYPLTSLHTPSLVSVLLSLWNGYDHRFHKRHEWFFLFCSDATEFQSEQVRRWMHSNIYLSGWLLLNEHEIRRLGKESTNIANKLAHSLGKHIHSLRQHTCNTNRRYDREQIKPALPNSQTLASPKANTKRFTDTHCHIHTQTKT